MTDQPTTWTPERALAMLRDWGGPIEALESAAAEIERQTARADGLVADLAACARDRNRETARADAAEKEVERLYGFPPLERQRRLAISVEANAMLEREIERLRAQVAERDCTVTDLVDERDKEKARADGLAADLAACVVRADAAEKEAAMIRDGTKLVREGLMAEVERLRAELAAMTQQRDVYCKEMLDAMKATKPAAQEGPSDEEVEALINTVKDGNTWKALRWVARRAGVKL